MARKIFLFIVLVAFALIAVLVLSAFFLNDTDDVIVQDTTTTLEVQEDASKTTLFGTMMAFNSNDGLGFQPDLQELLMDGWTTLRTDDDALETFFENLSTTFKKHGELVEQAGFSSNRDVVGAFVWNVIESEKGTYDWSVTDATMQAAQDADITISAVIQPFTSWDQDVDPEDYKQNCKAIDFGYYDFEAGNQVTDWNAYKNFLTAVVERYDGDGQDDMPGLTTRVEAWEIGNEVEGPCGGYLDDPEEYGELLKISFETIHAADATTLVLNAGALEITGHGSGPESTKTFWEGFFENGSDRYLDVFNFHYNSERAGAEQTPGNWIKHLDFFNDLMKESDGQKPLWVTEFGTYSGTPEMPTPPGDTKTKRRTLPTQSAEFQAAWYFRYAVIGFAHGVERIFIDVSGSSDNGIGASSLFLQGPGVDGEPREFLTTIQTLAKELNGFSQVDEIGDGQYKFTIGDRTVYALWEGSLPLDLRGQSLTVVDIDGKEQMVQTNDLELSVDTPVLILIE